ncbi:MAG: Crp/Fnr family transcriptional regulator [Coriobacteriia bacterium]|nr:Crp/Fnr family transcriptional regulator [Coriobacteriia bacterium]
MHTQPRQARSHQDRCALAKHVDALNDALKTVRLFDGIEEKDLLSMLSCLGAEVIRFDKNSFVLMAGNEPRHIGILLKGSAHVIQENMEGKRVIIETLSEGDYFAEALCCAGVKESPVSVVTTSETLVLMTAFMRILHTCPSSCIFHAQLIENMLFLIATKNILLQGRMDVISQKTVRKKVSAYLKSIAIKQGRRTISIPLNREELAAFLCVDRSALSHELSRMRQDGLIDYRKNEFTLH